MHQRVCRAWEGAEQSNLGPMGPGQLRTCLSLEIGQGHPQLCGEAWPSRQNPLPSALPYPGLTTHLAQPGPTVANRLTQPQLSQQLQGNFSSPWWMETFRKPAWSAHRRWSVSSPACLLSLPFFTSGRVKRPGQSRRATWSSYTCSCLRARPT